MTTQSNPVAAQIVRLPKLSMKALWDLWDSHFDQRPGNHNRGYVQSRLAYRLQELAYGVLSPALRKKLEKIGETGRLPEQTNKSSVQIAAGTMLMREYKGATHRATVLADGRFEYKGQPYNSLSAIARTITGTQWNGLVFFGVKKMGGKA
jgi:hypothetical protein